MDRPNAKKKRSLIKLNPFVFIIVLVSILMFITPKNNNTQQNQSETQSSQPTNQESPKSTEDPEQQALDKQLAEQQQKIKEAEENVRIAKANADAAAEDARKAQIAADEANARANSYSSGSSSYNSVQAPTNRVTTWSSAGKTSLVGTYYYKVSYVNSSGSESDLGPASFGVDIKNTEVWISGIPVSTDKDVTKRKIYRTLGDGSMVGPYYLLKTFYNNSTTSFWDDTPDSTISWQAPKY